MLNELRIANFKSFASPTTLPLGKLNVLLGKNNSGKTTIARIPIMFGRAFSERKPTPMSKFPLSADGLDFGSNMRDLASRQSPHADIQMGFSFTTDLGDMREVDFVLQLHQSMYEEGAFVSKFQSSVPALNIHWDKRAPLFGKVGYIPTVLGFEGVVPTMSTQREAALIGSLRAEILQTLGNIEHIASVRSPLRMVYENREPLDAAGHSGSEAPYKLKSSDKVNSFVADWYARNLGAEGLTVEPEVRAFRLALVGPTGDSINLARSGQGLQQALPVVAALAAVISEPDPSKILVIEEPEVHLHPSAHGSVADLFVRASRAANPPQLIVETHSENFVLRLRRRVATGELNPKDLNILWFEQVNGETVTHQVGVEGDGSVTDWPQGVFSESLDEVRAIARGRA